MQADALLIVPPFLKVTAGPLLGPAMLLGAGRSAGHRVNLVDLNADWLHEWIRGTEKTAPSPFVGDHDRPSTVLRQAQRAFAEVCSAAVPGGCTDADVAAHTLLGMRLGHAEVFLGAHKLAASDLGRWIRNALVSAPVPDVVGISVMYSGQVLAAVTTSIIAKELWPSAPVVWGGAHVTALRDEITRDPAYGAVVDRFVFGYSERTWVHLLDAVSSGTPMPRAAVVAGSGEGPTALDDPNVVPQFDNCDGYGCGRLTLPAQASRGCAYGRCTFCTYPAVEGKYRELGLGPALAVVDEAERLGAAVSFKDSLMLPARLSAVADAVAGRVAWSACTKLHASFDKGFLRALASAGCATLEFGLETLTPSGQLLIAKKQALPLFLRVLDAANDAGIAVVVNYITGFPGTEHAEELRWLDRVRSALLERPELVAKIEHNDFQLERMSPMGRDPFGHGLRVTRSWPWASVMEWEPVSVSVVQGASLTLTG